MEWKERKSGFKSCVCSVCFVVESHHVYIGWVEDELGIGKFSVPSARFHFSFKTKIEIKFQHAYTHLKTSSKQQIRRWCHYIPLFAQVKVLNWIQIRLLMPTSADEIEHKSLIEITSIRMSDWRGQKTGLRLTILWMIRTEAENNNSIIISIFPPTKSSSSSWWVLNSIANLITQFSTSSADKVVS